MNTIISEITDRLDDLSGPVLTTFARFVFAAVLFMYYWNSGLTRVSVL